MQEKMRVAKTGVPARKGVQAMRRNLWSIGQQALDKCPYCGAETRPGENFCLNCGNRLLSPTPSERENDMRDQPPRNGVQAKGRKLWSTGCSFLAIIAVILGVFALLGLLGFLIERGGNWSYWLIFLALGISLAIFNYKTAFPSRKRARTLLRLLEIMVIMLGLLGLLAGIFKIGGAWSGLMFLPLVINLPIVNYRYPRRRRRTPTSP
jgi:hypothetical protein